MTIVGVAELDVVARTAGFERSLRAQTEGSIAGLGKGAERQADEVERQSGRMRGSIAGVGGAFAVAGEKAEKATDPLKESFAGMLGPFGSIKVAGPAALAAVGAASIELGSKFQAATTQISVLGGTTQAQANAIGAAFLKTAGVSTFTAQQMAEAYAPVGAQLAQLNGHVLTVAQSVGFERAAADLAEASHSDLATTTATLANVMQAYHINVNDAAGATDTLFNVSRLTNTPIDALGGAMSRLHARLGQASPGLRDTGVLIDELAQQGIRGQRGILTVSTAMTTLLGGSKQTNDMLAQMGVHVFDAQGKFVGMGSVIAQMQPALAKMTDAQRFAAEKTLFGSQAAQIMGQVVAGGIPAYQKAATAISHVGSAHEGAERTAGTFEGRMKTAKSAVIDMGTQLGTALLPAVTKLADLFTHDLLPAISVVFGFFAHNIGWIGPLAGAILGLVAAWKLWTLAVKAWKLVMDTDPVMLALSALAIAVVLLATHWKEVWGAIKDVAEKAWKGIQTAISAVWNTALKPVFDAFRAAAGAIWTAVDTAWHGIDTVIHFVADHITQIIKALLIVGLGPLGIAIDLLWTHWHAVWSAIRDALNSVWNGILKPVLNAIKVAGLDVVRAGVDGLKAEWSVAWGVIHGALTAAWAIVSPILGAIKTLGLDVISAGIGALKTVWDTAWAGFHTAVDAMWAIVKPIFDTIKRVLGDIGTAAGAVGKGLGAVAKVGGAIGGAAGKVGSFLGLAGGGIITTPTLALVGEGTGPELVLPLNDTARMAQLLNKAAAYLPNVMAAASAAAGGSSSSSALYRAGIAPAPAGRDSGAPGGGGDTITVGPIYSVDPRQSADEMIRKLRSRQWMRGR